MNRQTEEHKQHLSESLRRFWSTLSPEERERRRAECVRCGLKSVAMRTPEEMAAQIARLQRPEVRARNAEAVAKRKAQLTAEDPDWMKKILREKWSRHDPLTEAQRKTRAENARRMRAQMTPEQTAALQEASRKARRKPIEGHPDSTTGEVVRFASAGDAAEWLLSTGVGKSLRGVRHLIYESLAGRRDSAYGYKWQHSSSEG